MLTNLMFALLVDCSATSLAAMLQPVDVFLIEVANLAKAN